MNNKKSMLFTIIIVFILTFNYLSIEGVTSTEIKTRNSNIYGKGFRYNIQGWVYLHIEGEPYERGYQYGYLCSNEIVDMMNRWSCFGSNVKVASLFKIKEPEKWWELCKSISIKNSLNEYPKEYQDEIRGIADGVRDKGGTIHGHPVEFEDILTLNEMQSCWYRLKYLFKMFHPLKDAYNAIKSIVSYKHEDDEGFCSVFIATGDATKTGEIVAVHSTQPLYYLDERFNFVVEVQPSNGKRFMMAGTPPGFIWSLVNFYQNEEGIILMESTLPQGPWKRKGVPISVRSRKAIQYSDCIDDVISNLKEGNNGLYECEWLIGDTKTGEIASIELALYNTPIKRTYNGFYWSCNHPHDPKVQREVSGGMPLFISNIATNVFENSKNLRVEKFQEVEQDYYGEIDISNTKEIISTDPLCINSCDAKITSSSLLKDMGLVLHMGNPNGEEWIPTSEQKEKFTGVTNLPSSGWMELYPPNGKRDSELYKNENREAEKTSKLLWTCKIKGEDYKKTGLSSCKISQDSLYVVVDSNAYVINKETGERTGFKSIDEIKQKQYGKDSIVTTSFSGKNVYGFSNKDNEKLWEFQATSRITQLSAIRDSELCFGSWDGRVYLLNSLTGEKNWDFETGWGVVTKPVITDKFVLFGSLDNNFYALNKNTGKLEWSFPCYAGIQSNPAVYGEYVFFGCDDGIFYALDKDTGKLGWDFKPKYSIEDNIVQNYLTTPINSDPVIDNGTVYISVEDTIYALDAQTTESRLGNSDLKQKNSNDYIIPMAILTCIIILLLVIIFIRKYKK